MKIKYPNEYRDRFNLDSWNVLCPVCKAEMYFDPRALRGYAMCCDSKSHEYNISFKHEPRSRIKSNKIFIEDDYLLLKVKEKSVMSITRYYGSTRIYVGHHHDEIIVPISLDIEKYNTIEKAKALFKRLAILK